MKHFSEADLLETYYTAPGESMPVMMHLAECAECQARYERLERKLRSLSSCEAEKKPDTFWTRQRYAILRRVNQQRTQSRTSRMAAAAVLAFVLGGVAMWKSVERHPEVVKTTTSASASVPATAEPTIPADPWESDELKDYESMVNWESWGDPKGES